MDEKIINVLLPIIRNEFKANPIKIKLNENTVGIICDKNFFIAGLMVLTRNVEWMNSDDSPCDSQFSFSQLISFAKSVKMIDRENTNECIFY